MDFQEVATNRMNQMALEITNIKAQNKYLFKTLNRLEISQEDKNDEMFKRIQKLETQNSESQTPQSLQFNSFNEIPRSCQDLNLIGHRLSGFYNVRGLGENSNQIETVFCKFNSQRDQITLEQKKLQQDNTLAGIIIFSRILSYFSSFHVLFFWDPQLARNEWALLKLKPNMFPSTSRRIGLFSIGIRKYLLRWFV